MMLLQFLFAILIILLIVDRWKPKKFMKLHQQLGNDWLYLPILGNGLKLLGNNEDRMRTFLESSLQCYKKKYRGISFWIGHIFIVGIVDANDACVLLKSALDKKFIHDVTKDLIGNGSVFAPVEFWHRRRKILVPTFAPRYVSKFVTVFERQSKVTAELLESRIGKGNFSCSDFINFYGLDSLCETVFGVNMNMQRTPDHPFFNALSQCLENMGSRVCQPWLFIDAIYTRLPLYTRHQQVIKILKDFVFDLIIKKKTLLNDKERNKDEYGDTTGKPENDFKTFVELMIGSSNETDNKYTDEELREETLVLAVAGSDTSTGAIKFTLLLLSQHADVQDKVYKEIQEILGDSDKPLQAEDLLKLKYTRAVIKESIRLYPPVPFIIRHCKNDVELPSGLVLPAGCNVVISIWGIQRNPEHWGEDASDFNPDRFMSDKISTPNAFIAFSHGSRNCIGQQYAMLSMTTMLVTLLRRYRFTPAADFKYDKNNSLRLSFDIMMKHVEDYPVQIEYRYKCK